ncbi:MAG: copper amine oxidase N-terminal domain-containing protein, partial [Armatimonadota bacterium]
FEASDGVLYWYPVEKRVRAVRPGTELAIQIGDPAVQVNEDTRVLQVAPYIKQGRTMVPLQFIADTLNVTVTFNPDTGQICLTSNDF